MSRADQVLDLIAAAAGGGELERVCGRFSSALAELRGVGAASVWLRRELLARDGSANETGGEELIVRHCSAPDGFEEPRSVPVSLKVLGRAIHDGSAFASLPDEDGDLLAGVTSPGTGRLLVVPLLDLGFITLWSESGRHPLGSVRKDEIRVIVTVFATAVREALARRELRRERARHERIMARTEEHGKQLWKLLDNLVDIVVVLDFDTRIRFANEAGARVLGYQPDELLGRSLLEMVPPQDAGPTLQLLQQHLTEPMGSGEVRLNLQARDGSWREMDGILYSALSVPGLEGLVLSCHDVTELEEARRAAERASQVRERFLATVSHEIRTPMNGVLGMASLLEETPLTSEQRELVQTVRSSGESLLAILNEVLDFSRLESGGVRLEQRTFDPVALAEDVVSLMAPRIERPALELILKVGETVPSRFEGDPLRIRQVLINLLSNAVKFTAEGYVEVVLDAETEADGSCRLEFRVADSGEGIPEDRQESLFRPYVQADASVARRRGGTGLGLAISRRLCELMGGGITFESTEGEGSTFRFWVTGTATQSEPWLEGHRAPELAGRTAVVAVGDERLRKALIGTLEAWGLEIVWCATRQEANRCLEVHRPDVAVVDLLAAGDDEPSPVPGLRRAAGRDDLPVVLLAGASGREAGPSAEEPVQAVWRVLRPVRPTRLHGVFLEALGGRTADERQASSDVPQPSGFEGLRVLVADDNPVNRQVVTLMLVRLGCEVESAENGQQALERLREARFDTVLMDVRMPEMDGFEATRRIRSDRRYGQTRVIGLTAAALDGDRERCLAAGMDEYLAKPVRLEELRRVLARPERSAPGARDRDRVAPEELPAVDPRRLETLTELGGGSFVERILAAFSGQSERYLADLESAAEAEDEDRLLAAAHALKGSALNLGFARVGALAASLEVAVRKGSWSAAGGLVGRIKEELPQAEAAMADALGAM